MIALGAIILSEGTLIAGAWAGTGAITLTAEDAPGEIVVDGVPSGVNAPGTVRGLEEGLRHVTLSYGCLHGEAKVAVLSGRVARFDLPLVERSGDGWVQVDGLIRGAKAELDGHTISGTAKVPCGAHWLSVTAGGYADYSQVVLVEPDQLALIVPVLRRVPIYGDLDRPEPVDPAARSESVDNWILAGGLLGAGATSAILGTLSWQHASRAKAHTSDVIEQDPFHPATDLMYSVDVRPYRWRAIGGWAAAAALVGGGVAVAF